MQLSRIVRILVATMSGAALLACGGDSTSSSEQLASVDVQPRDASLMLFALWPHMHQTAISQRGAQIKTPGVWSSSDPSIVSVDASTGALTANAVGSADVTDRVTFNGVTESGVSHVTVSAQADTGSVTATVSAAFTPQLRTVARNGGIATVTWVFEAEPHTVTWDSQPPGANVANIPASSSTSASVGFAVAGTYEYHCAIHSGMTGSLLVQ
jgi:plastocyanin